MNTTLQQSIASISAETEKKISGEKIRFAAAEKTGIDVANIIFYTSSNCIGFGWRTPLDKESVSNIFANYPVNGENYEMKFAGSDKNFSTDSPLTVSWCNDDNGTETQFKIEYPSNGVNVSIVVPIAHFGKHVYGQLRKGKHLGFGNYQQHRDINIDYFYTQAYSFGHRRLYFLEGAESAAEYENFIKTGVFTYTDEIPTLS